MSAGEKAFGLFKTFMLMTERFDAMDLKLKTVSADQAALSQSHSDLAQRVAKLEGFLEGAAAASRTPRIEG